MLINIDTDKLVDIRDIQVDKTMSPNERRREYNRQIKDINHFKCGTVKINVKFADNGKSLEECLRSSASS